MELLSVAGADLSGRQPRREVNPFALRKGTTVKYSSMAAMARGLEKLQDAEVSGEIKIVRCKNRWARATGGGWADLPVNFSFCDGPAALHVCELQFVHTKLMIVRKQMDAHHEYGIFRAANELLELHAGPDFAAELADEPFCL